MELAFQTQALRDICEDADRASSEFGGDVAAALRHRLADLRAAVSLNDVIVGHPQVDGQLVSIEIGDTHLLRLAANHVKNPVSADGTIDWKAISRLRVLELSRRGD